MKKSGTGKVPTQLRALLDELVLITELRSFKVAKLRRNLFSHHTPVNI
jgi:hypothetical protein